MIIRSNSPFGGEAKEAEMAENQGCWKMHIFPKAAIEMGDGPPFPNEAI